MNENRRLNEFPKFLILLFHCTTHTLVHLAPFECLVAVRCRAASNCAMPLLRRISVARPLEYSCNLWQLLVHRSYSSDAYYSYNTAQVTWDSGDFLDVSCLFLLST